MTCRVRWNFWALALVATMTLGGAQVALAACDPLTEVSHGGNCYYLDGSGGVCDSGYSLASQSILTSIAAGFAGKTYKHTVSNNCCIYNADPDEDWGMGNSCNATTSFGQGEPALGGSGCTDGMILDSAQLTLCAKVDSGSPTAAPAASFSGLVTLAMGLALAGAWAMRSSHLSRG